MNYDDESGVSGEGLLRFSSYSFETKHEASHLEEIGKGYIGGEKAVPYFGAVATPESVIGPDDGRRPLSREEAAKYPGRAICLLQIKGQNGQMAVGTGWLAEPRLVITAAHNVFNPDALGGYAHSITVIPGCWRGQSAAAPLAATRVFVTDSWRQNQSSAEDIAGIALSNDIGTSLGYFAYTSTGGGNFEAIRRVTICGFPIEDPTVAYVHSDEIAAISPEAVWYKVDTSHGQSGSPVWVDVPGQAVRQVIAVHTRDESLAPPSVGEANHGVRITQRFASLITHWARSS